MRLIDDTPGIGLDKGADIPGAVLLVGGLMLGVYTILEVADVGWGATQTLVLGAISIALEAAFIYRQSRIETPLMPLRLFRSRNVTGANTIQALLVAGMFAMFFLGALYLQEILGYSPLEVGLAFLPTTIVMGTLSLGFSEKLIMRFGPRQVLIVGLFVIGAGLLLFARTPVEGHYVVDLLPAMLLVGIGVGSSFPSLMTLAMSGATPEDAGLASGLVNTSAQVGGAVGLAVLATLATQRTDNLSADGVSHLAALNSGFHLAYLVGAALVGVGACDRRARAPLRTGAGGRRGSRGRLRALARTHLLGGLAPFVRERGRFEHAEQLPDAADQQPLLVDLDPDPGARREDDVVARADRHLDPGLGPPVEAGTDREDHPLLGRRLMGAGGTTSPERRTRSWSSSLITTWSNSGRSWWRTDSVGSGLWVVLNSLLSGQISSS